MQIKIRNTLLVLLFILVGCGSNSNSSSSEDSSQRYSNSYEHSDENIDKNSSNYSSNSTSNVVNITQNKSDFMLTAWNDLGMHCMDGKDFSVFSILPPYNNLHAQIKDKNGDLITTGITLTYEAVAGTDGKWNTNSIETTNGAYKTNFWDYVKDLFGVTLNPNSGLTGNSTPTKSPSEMKFNETYGWWEAEGIPITPYNDDGTKNYYPMVKVTAKDSNGNILTSVNTVLPVSDEMDCKKCHSSNSLSNDAKPNKGWVNNSDIEKDYKFNILRLHDQNHPTAVSSNLAKLQAKGYSYDTEGLEATAEGGKPILCVACHKSNALPNVGIELKQFTTAIHSKHANVKDPITGIRVGDSSNRDSCYACHPGASTKCLRGAMGDAKDSTGVNSIQCQSCHGDMQNVGDSKRDGWLDEPNCQACHHDGKRELNAIDPRTNTLRDTLDRRFATNPDTPIEGKSLFRFSKGHGKLQCEACHGSTHAIFPAHEADNILSTTIQGHIGTVAECSACHNSIPNTTTGGPHGMHPIGQSWVNRHEDVAERDSTQCKVCHGSNYKGSHLSKTFANRSFSTEWGSKSFSKGHKVSCYDCHNGADGDDE